MTATQRPAPPRLRRSPVGVPARPHPAPPPLRVVDRSELSPGARRRRRRLLVGGTGVVTALGLFAVVVVHVVLAQQQFQLAALSSRIAAARSANDQLSLQVAQLQAPERVVSDARRQLGMVSPPSITYLVPGHRGPLVRAQPAAAPTTPAAAGTTSTTATTATTRP
ncbi:MAG TPA: septum formation initiator family protein [Acidimicrobiales bacterium]|nr:septum formation initiator family protein [Acidimicrobiales bacterium]